MSSRARSLAVAIVGALALACGPVAPAASEQGPTSQWFTAWSTSQQSLGNTAMTDATVRLMARVTAGGESIRIRLDNTYGTGPLVIGAVTVGVPVRGATLAPGSTRAVTFNGESRVTIPPDGSVQSDPISISVIARQDLAVSLFIPETDVRTSQHNGARITSYLTENGGGDRTSDESSDGFTLTTTSMFWLKSIDVLSDSVTGTIVAFGDSITDGSCSTTDGHDRWQDWLALRLHLDAGGSGVYKTVINEGIGGNTVTSDVQPPPASTPGVDRLERDVLSHAGVTDVVLFMGTNDIRREATAAQVIAGMEEIVERVQAHGAKVLATTIIPRHNRAPTETNSGWDPTKTAVRNEVNAWIRDTARLDGVLDFDQIVRDPEHHDLILPVFNCDDIHPTPRGYYEMGMSVPLALFR